MYKKIIFLFTVLLNIITLEAINAASVTDPVIIQITDTTLDNVYYHQQQFTVPTKLVFTNLTSVSGYVYFHQNANLVEVDFPVLTQTGRYFYFYGNTSLHTVNAPNLHTVEHYAFVSQNTSLTTFNICGLTEILPLEDDIIQPSYYYIHENTPAVDNGPYCFSMGAPTNLALSNNTINENQPISTFIGNLSASSNYPNGYLTYYLVPNSADNNSFKIVGNQLLTNATFNFEVRNSYTISIGVRNQLGEKMELQFTINVQDISIENLSVVEITDTTLDNIYYHQQQFSVPTKLVFTNLTSVSGYVYFHQNTNLVEVDFPVLTQTGGYFFCNGNNSLLTMNAPALNSIYRYLYVSGNASLTELNVCGLTEILDDDDQDSYPTYYYIENNPVLDFDSTCLENTTLEFMPDSDIVIMPAGQTRIGTFTSDTPGPLNYFFTNSNGDPTPNTDFILVDNQLYLAHEASFYDNGSFNIHVAAINNNNSNGRSSANGLNEKIQVAITFDSSALHVNQMTKEDLNAVYPNPAGNYFEINTQDILQNIAIYDVLGRQLSNFTVTQNKVDVTNLPNGNYIVKATTNEKSFVKKLLIRK